VSPLLRSNATILQLNIGLYCNQACTHCHVESSPKRTEMMDRRVASKCLDLLKASPNVTTLDLTGGAPELNSQFRYLVREAATLNVEIIDRCNLTVLVEPGQEDLAEFLAEHKV
jgi:radical SAM/Cys-rich protein